MQLIKNVKIIDINSAFHGKVIDILIEDGIIKELGQDLENPGAVVYELEGVCVSVGWMDIGAWSGDPGYEFREDLQSLANTAARGGFTALAVLPNADPPANSKSEILYIKHHSASLPVEFFPLGTITRSPKSNDIAELFDMYTAGAVAFTNGIYPLQDSGTLMRALQYVKAFDGLIINRPYLNELAIEGQMHEGAISVALGLKGIPKITEFLAVQRNIWLAEYTQSNIHLQSISCAESAELIRKAKQQGVPVTASVSVLHLGYDHTALDNFDVNYKVLPPLSTSEDRKALLEGIKDGTIDCINSDHLPIDSDSKDEVFPHSPFGIIGLETAFPELSEHLENILSLDQQIEKLTITPRALLNLEIPKIEKEAAANLTFFHPAYSWKYHSAGIRSKSANSPFIDKTYQSAVIGIAHRRQLIWEPPE